MGRLQPAAGHNKSGLQADLSPRHKPVDVLELGERCFCFCASVMLIHKGDWPKGMCVQLQGCCLACTCAGIPHAQLWQQSLLLHWCPQRCPWGNVWALLPVFVTGGLCHGAHSLMLKACEALPPFGLAGVSVMCCQWLPGPFVQPPGSI